MGKIDKIEIEKDLVLGLKKRSPVALSDLYDRYSPAIHGVIFRIVGSDMISEDILQAVFMKIWDKIDQYNSSKGRLFTWMLNIARNTAIDHVRSKAFKRSRLSQPLDSSVSQVDQIHKVETKVESIDLKEKVDRLKPEFRDVVDLLYFQGFTHKEAAEELGIPLGTVKTRVKAAVNQLRKVYL